MGLLMRGFKNVFFCLFVLCGVAKGYTEETFPYPVDIVYLWVNGGDVEWRRIRDAYVSHNSETVSDANVSYRYSDNDELKYSLRSVMEYASFFNHIYIVTMDQVPKWFVEHPRITIVDHTEIFKHQEDLPTFNSMAIEANIHRIPNLSEHFIYFNDDMFLGDYVKATDFFSESGLVRVMFEKSCYSPSGIPLSNEIGFLRASRNTNNLLNQTYQKKRRLFVCHAPYALRKSYMESSEREFAQAFAMTSSHKFRSPEDYTITNGLVQYHWKYIGKVEQQKNLKNVMVLLNGDRFSKTKRALEEVKHDRPHTFCLQDKMSENDRGTKIELHRFLEEMYPCKAKWEK